jgi:hypothetical protein
MGGNSTQLEEMPKNMHMENEEGSFSWAIASSKTFFDHAKIILAG